MIDISRVIGESFFGQAKISYDDSPTGIIICIIKSDDYYKLELFFDKSDPTNVTLFKFHGSSHPIWCEEIDLHDPESLNKLQRFVDELP